MFFKSWKELSSILIVIFFVLIFRSIGFEPFRIPSGSMIPTLMIGDFILVNKFAYGVKVPFSDLSLSDSINLNPIYIFGKKDPERGDVVVFKFPKDHTINYIKRVVGLPGDTLEIKSKVVYINGNPIQMKEFQDQNLIHDMDEKYKTYRLKFYKAKTGKHVHAVQFDGDNYYKADQGKIVIPSGKFFMMGDNRDFSSDSRFWGLVSHEEIKGKAFGIWFSMITPFNEDGPKLRTQRIGLSIN
jgi:signal peptidase I